MNKEIKAQWLAALRSGKYKQTTGVLRQDHTNEMCCLGVLCDILAPNDWDGQGYHRNELQLPSGSICEQAGLPPPYRGVSALGIETVTGETLTNKLAGLNDQSENFDRVIEMIEQEL